MWSELFKIFMETMAVSLGITASILIIFFFLAGLGLIVKIFEKKDKGRKK